MDEYPESPASDIEDSAYSSYAFVPTVVSRLPAGLVQSRTPSPTIPVSHSERNGPSPAPQLATLDTLPSMVPPPTASFDALLPSMLPVGSPSAPRSAPMSDGHGLETAQDNTHSLGAVEPHHGSTGSDIDGPGSGECTHVYAQTNLYSHGRYAF